MFAMFRGVSTDCSIARDLLERASKNEFDIYISLVDTIDNGKSVGKTQTCLTGILKDGTKKIIEVGLDLQQVLDRFKKDPKPTYGIHINLAKKKAPGEDEECDVTAGEFALNLIHELVVHGKKTLSVTEDFSKDLSSLIKGWGDRRKEGDLSQSFHHEEMKDLSTEIGFDFAQDTIKFLQLCEKQAGGDFRKKAMWDNVGEDALIGYRLDTGIKAASASDLSEKVAKVQQKEKQQVTL